MKKPPYNPFVFGPPIQDPAFFFGREHERQMILNTISHTMPGLRQSMAIVGPRRIGKSSILFQLIHRLRETSHITALISTERFDVPSPLLLGRTILSELREDGQAKNVVEAQVVLNLLDHPAPPDDEIFLVFRRDLKRLNDSLARAKHPPAILMIDEVEGLIEFGGLRVLGVFRDLAQSLPYVMFMVAGSDRLYQLMNDNTSPFFNVFKTITISPLNEVDAGTMIMGLSQQAHLRFQEASINKVVKISGGIPYLINMIAHYATEVALTHNHPTVTIECIDTASRHILNHEQGYFIDIWQRAVGLEKVALYALAIANTPCLLSEIVTNVGQISEFNQSMAHIQDLIKQLVRRQILKVTHEGEYGFSNELIPIWIRNNRTEAQVVEDALPPIPSFGSDTEGERVFLEQLLQIHRDNLAFLEQQYADNDKILLIQQRIYSTVQRLEILENKPINPISDILTVHPNHPMLSLGEQQELVDELSHLENLYSIIRKNLRITELQAAKFSTLYVPLHISSEIESIQKRLQDMERRIFSIKEKLNPSIQESLSISEEEEHKRSLLLIYRRNLQALEVKAAHYGVSIPIELLNDIEHTKDNIQKLNESIAVLVDRRGGNP